MAAKVWDKIGLNNLNDELQNDFNEIFVVKGELDDLKSFCSATDIKLLCDVVIEKMNKSINVDKVLNKAKLLDKNNLVPFFKTLNEKYPGIDSFKQGLYLVNGQYKKAPNKRTIEKTSLQVVSSLYDKNNPRITVLLELIRLQSRKDPYSKRIHAGLINLLDGINGDLSQEETIINYTSDGNKYIKPYELDNLKIRVSKGQDIGKFWDKIDDKPDLIGNTFHFALTDFEIDNLPENNHGALYLFENKIPGRHAILSNHNLIVDACDEPANPQHLFDYRVLRSGTFLYRNLIRSLGGKYFSFNKDKKNKCTGENCLMNHLENDPTECYEWIRDIPLFKLCTPCNIEFRNNVIDNIGFTVGNFTNIEFGLRLLNEKLQDKRNDLF